MRKSKVKRAVSMLLMSSLIATSVLSGTTNGAANVKAEGFGSGDRNIAMNLPEESIQPEELIKPEEPTQPEEPIEPEKPTQPEEPIEPEKPTQPEEPIQPEETTQPEDPIHSQLPKFFDIPQLYASTYDDAIFDTWENNANITAEKNELTADHKWRNIVSKDANTNTNLNNNVFIIKEADAFQDGYFEATIKPNSAPADTRMGFVVRYDNTNKTGIFIGYDPGGWYWQIYDGNQNPWYGGGRVAAPNVGTENTIRMDFSGNSMNVTLNGAALFNNVDISTIPNSGKIGVKMASFTSGSIIAKSAILFKEVHYTGQPAPVMQEVTGTILGNGNPIEGALVKLDNQKANTAADGTFQFHTRDFRTYDLSVLKDGYVDYNQSSIVVSGGAVSLGNISLTKESVIENTLSSEAMDVTIDENFPRVIKYTMKTGTDNGKVFYGQAKQLDKITINGKDVKPLVTSTKSGNNKMQYELTVKDVADSNNVIDAIITCELTVIGNTLGFKVTGIQDNSMVKTIEIKNHSLISVRSTQQGANLQGANMSTNTHVSGDREVIVDDNLNVASEAVKGYMYAFVSNNDLSAGLWSNSENKVNSDWQRVTATAQESSYKSIGLQSTYWTYQNSSEDRKEDGTIEYTRGADIDGKNTIAISELPECKVVICGDENEDGSIDWQDGAIGYRTIMNNPVGAQKVPELVAYRIAMNFGSQAQNPFLMTLDNVKKIALHTDGLGQSILLKGYGSEGHDSGHLDYADIGRRIGGAEEMKVLLEKGKEYGATFGIHVNASETYPESKYFTDPILRKEADGSYSYGWNWIDQGININALYDLRNGRVDRWKDLYNELGGKNNNLDFIYVDVWGNGQSGDNGTWPSRQLAKEISGHGWRVASEWGYANEYDSTFQHWAADLTYGGYKLKGINSNITKFIRNHQKDSWVGNYLSYGGEADAPLLGAYNMKDFEGWQGRSNYADYIYTLFEVNVASKLVQHFKVMDWENGTSVTMSDNGETYQWTPGMRAELKTDDKSHSLKIVRNSNDFANDKTGYRTRTMEFDGKKIYEGMEGDTKYLIPWIWDKDGKVVSSDKEKLYHWNTKGGTTTWDVPAGWTSSAKVYRLDDLGKQDVKTVNIINGQITLTAEAKTPYVILKNEELNRNMTWSDGMKIVDSGFNSGSLNAWTVEGAVKPEDAKIFKSQGSNPMLKIENNQNKVLVSQKITDLKPNTKYAAYVGIDNRSKSKASLTVTGGKEKASSYTAESIALNFIKAYAHNTNKSTATIGNVSYFQNMYVFFETGSDLSNVKITLDKEAGDGAVYFDDIRICENNSIHYPDNPTFKQDFENVAQGIYPFVIGNIEGVEDNRTHLSQKNDPYTQRGWNNKRVNDVIEGAWSLKTNGLVGRDSLVYQTIPQNFRFEPGATYEITFDYEAGSDGTYAFAVGKGDYVEKDGIIEKKVELNSTIDETAGKGTFTTKLIGDKSGQGWIGIYSTTKPTNPDESGLTDKEISFRGYSDFMLDNLVIKKLDIDKSALLVTLDEAETKLERYFTAESYLKFKPKYEAALIVYQDILAQQAGINTATAELKKAMSELVPITINKDSLKAFMDECKQYAQKDYLKLGWQELQSSIGYAEAVIAANITNQTIINKAFELLVKAELILLENKGTDVGKDMELDRFSVNAGSVQPNYPGEGDAIYAVDNDKETIWHTSWSGGDRKDYWFQFNLKEATTVNGVRYMRRQGGGNGAISEYKISISKDNGNTFTDVSTGTWDAVDSWQIGAFEEQSGVTNVRIYAVNSTGNFASAAEFRITEIDDSEIVKPTSLTVQNASVGQKNGKVMGVTNKMEYSDKVLNGYTDCTSSEITGLAAGVYYIRFKAEENKINMPVKLVIYEGDVPSFPAGNNGNGGGTSGSTSEENINNPEDNVEETPEQKTVTTVDVKKKENGTITSTYKVETTIKATGEIIKTTVVKNELKSGEKKLTVSTFGTNSEVTVKGTASVQKDGKTSTDFTLTTDKVTVEKTGAVTEVMTNFGSNEIKAASEALKKALGHSPDLEIQLSVVIPKKQAVEAIKDKKSKDVILSIILPDHKVKYNNNQIVLSKDIINAAKGNKKDITIIVMNADKKTNVTWSFSKNLLKASNTKIKDINLLVKTETVSNTNASKKILKEIIKKDTSNGETNSLLISFGEKSKLPSTAQVTIPLDGKFKKGKSVYLFTMDSKAKKLKYLPNNQYIVNEDGTVTIHVLRGMEYVLLPAKPDAKTGVTLVNQVAVKLKAKTIVSGKSTKINIDLPETIKKVNTYSKTNKDEAIDEAKITYKSSNTSLAAVDKSGNIIGKNKGKAEISTTVLLKNGSKKTVKSILTIK